MHPVVVAHPVHLSPQCVTVAKRISAMTDAFNLIEPLNVLDFVTNIWAQLLHIMGRIRGVEEALSPE